LQRLNDALKRAEAAELLSVHKQAVDDLLAIHQDVLKATEATDAAKRAYQAALSAEAELRRDASLISEKARYFYRDHVPEGMKTPDIARQIDAQKEVIMNVSIARTPDEARLFRKAQPTTQEKKAN